MEADVPADTSMVLMLVHLLKLAGDQRDEKFCGSMELWEPEGGFRWTETGLDRIGAAGPCPSIRSITVDDGHNEQNQAEPGETRTEEVKSSPFFILPGPEGVLVLVGEAGQVLGDIGSGLRPAVLKEVLLRTVFCEGRR